MNLLTNVACATGFGAVTTLAGVVGGGIAEPRVAAAAGLLAGFTAGAVVGLAGLAGGSNIPMLQKITQRTRKKLAAAGVATAGAVGLKVGIKLAATEICLRPLVGIGLGVATGVIAGIGIEGILNSRRVDLCDRAKIGFGIYFGSVAAGTAALIHFGNNPVTIIPVVALAGGIISGIFSLGRSEDSKFYSSH